jgi:hypothetical protein
MCFFTPSSKLYHLNAAFEAVFPDTSNNLLKLTLSFMWLFGCTSSAQHNSYPKTIALVFLLLCDMQIIHVHNLLTVIYFVTKVGVFPIIQPNIIFSVMSLSCVNLRACQSNWSIIIGADNLFFNFTRFNSVSLTQHHSTPQTTHLSSWCYSVFPSPSWTTKKSHLN